MEELIKKLAMKISLITHQPMPLITQALNEALLDSSDDKTGIKAALIEHYDLVPASELKKAIALCDMSEEILDLILRKQTRGDDALAYTMKIDGVWTELSNARLDAGRKLPNEA